MGFSSFMTYMKKELTNLLTIHFVINRKQLLAKYVNKIKAHTLNIRFSKQLCQETDEECITSTLHTEVRWLS